MIIIACLQKDRGVTFQNLMLLILSLLVIFKIGGHFLVSVVLLRQDCIFNISRGFSKDGGGALKLGEFLRLRGLVFFDD